MRSQLQIFQVLSAALAASFAAGTLPQDTDELLADFKGLTAQSAYPGFSVPNADGLVELTDNADWAGHPVQVAEITYSQSGDAQARALANLTEANGRYEPGTNRDFIGACYEVTLKNGQGTVDESKPIMGSTSFPGKLAPDGTSNLGTAAGVLEWCAKVKPAHAGPADPHGHVPGA